MSTLDLGSFDTLTRNQEEGQPLEVKHPVTGDPIGLTLCIAGAESEVARKLQRRQTNERIRNQRKRFTAEDIERNQREALITLVLGWEFKGLTLDGETPAFSKEAVENLIRRFPWIAAQVDDFASDQANFLSN